MSTQLSHVIIVGGGAAGFFGAISAKSSVHPAHPHNYPPVQVTLLEAARQPLSKVRVSGGGRSNVTHACFDPAVLVQHYPRGGKALRGAFTRFQPRDTIAWFEAQGVKLKTEADGRMFPVSDDSETIVGSLMQAATRAGVKIWTGAVVKSVMRQEEGFQVQLKSGEALSCDRLLLATGNSPQGYVIAQSLGHQIEPPVPSLFTFNINDPRLQELAGVSVNAVHLRLQVGEKTHLEQIGPLLITHWGVSGPAVLKLSAWGSQSIARQPLSSHVVG
ncbi:aminoacetone oxidase family FAD-binding enzyme [Kovacikia minuta]|uniref:aminoacetone oxidase family FAD-binding enzyme n=1 Tax=Kovacikia minuta TaxID=2931930 RepID=UPI0036F1CA19